MEYIKNNIYYLNLEEIKQICTKYNIPFHVYYKYQNILYQSNTMLRKGKIIKNILKSLDNKIVRKYIIPEINVNFERPKYSLNHNIYFGQYKWTDAKHKIFPNYFKPVICQLMLFNLWHKNKTFTYKDFIKYYDKHYEKYDAL